MPPSIEEAGAAGVAETGVGDDGVLAAMRGVAIETGVLDVVFSIVAAAVSG